MVSTRVRFDTLKPNSTHDAVTFILCFIILSFLLCVSSNKPIYIYIYILISENNRM